MKKSFVYYTDWAEQLLELPKELRLKIDDAIKRYVLYGEEPTDKEVLYSMFGLMRLQIDRDVEKWEDIREKRSEAGKRHKGNQHTKTEQMEQMEQMFQNGTNGTVNVNANVNVNGLSNDNIKENSKRTTSKVKHDDESLPDYVTPDFADIYREWMNYRSQVGKPYKSDIGRKRFYNELVRLSDGDPEKARLIIQQSEANEWQGIFELKQDNNNDYEQRNTNNRPNNRPSPEQNIADAQKAAIERMQSVINSAD